MIIIVTIIKKQLSSFFLVLGTSVRLFIVSFKLHNNLLGLSTVVIITILEMRNWGSKSLGNLLKVILMELVLEPRSLLLCSKPIHLTTYYIASNIKILLRNWDGTWRLINVFNYKKEKIILKARLSKRKVTTKKQVRDSINNHRERNWPS